MFHLAGGRLVHGRVHCALLFGAGFLLAFAGGSDAGPVNPDISVIGDTRAIWSESEDDVSLVFEEAEISMVGALNPYASAIVTLGITEEEGIDIEEAKLSLDRYFPGGFGLTAGKYLVDYGQLNQVHAHTYPFIDRPLMHQAFFGEEGIKDVGVRLDWIAPSPWETVSVRAAAGGVRGDLFLGPEDEREVPEGEEEPEPEIGGTGRLELFVEPSENTSFQLGGSVLYGKFDPQTDAYATWAGPDLKVRFDLGPQTTLIVNGEATFGSLNATAATPSADPNGWFTSADFRANKRWNFGGFAESTTGRFQDDARTNRYGGFVGFALLEETTLFRVLGRTTDPEDGDSEAEAIVQAIFGLGPHRAHRY
jgi:hypothetical protein